VAASKRGPNTVPPTEKSGSARSRALLLRRRADGLGPPLTEAEKKWLDDYEAERVRDARAKQNIFGKRSGRTIHIEEADETIGAGDAATTAAAAAAASSREEGRRYDYLMQAGIQALQLACKLHENMAAALLQRTIASETANAALIESVRTHFLARLDAEADAAEAARAAEKEGGAFDKMAEQLMPMILAKLATNGKPL
jgi:hypothetical protein